MKPRGTIVTLLCCLTAFGLAQQTHVDPAVTLKDTGLNELGAYRILDELCNKVGNRISGSANADKAVEWGVSMMNRLGFENVRTLPCMVPHWVRGPKEEVILTTSSGDQIPVTACALGMSPGTPAEGVEAEVIEVHSLDEVTKLGDKAKGKIIFYNRPFDPTYVTTFQSYGAAGDQRFRGPATAAKVGAVGALVRSMTHDLDDVPHTGTTTFEDKDPKIPAAALSLIAANKLHRELAMGPVKARITLSCELLPDVPSASVIGEIRGSEKPNEVLVMGGHLDSWDKGQGAHDDGAGVAGSLEALRLIKSVGIRPKRTIRVVLFMNEENGGRGGASYYEYAKTSGENAISAIESDSGGFAPRGFSFSLPQRVINSHSNWRKALALVDIDHLTSGGGGGADVGHLEPLKTVLIGLEPESQRYFDYHHSTKDTIDKVNARELELGAIGMAMLSWLISEEGI